MGIGGPQLRSPADRGLPWEIGEFSDDWAAMPPRCRHGKGRPESYGPPPPRNARALYSATTAAWWIYVGTPDSTYCWIVPVDEMPRTDPRAIDRHVPQGRNGPRGTGTSGIRACGQVVRNRSPLPQVQAQEGRADEGVPVLGTGSRPPGGPPPIQESRPTVLRAGRTVQASSGARRCVAEWGPGLFGCRRHQGR